jgi:hypothetical protein
LEFGQLAGEVGANALGHGAVNMAQLYSVHRRGGAGLWRRLCCGTFSPLGRQHGMPLRRRERASPLRPETTSSAAPSSTSRNRP